MSDPIKPLSLNNPQVDEAAKKIGLPTHEFVELCVLQTIQIMQEHPDDYNNIGSFPERLEGLRLANAVVQMAKKLPPFERNKINEEFPHLNINTEEQT